MDIIKRLSTEIPPGKNLFTFQRARVRTLLTVGDLDGARAAVADLRSKEARHGVMARILALKAEAEIALAEGHAGSALELLARMSNLGFPRMGGIDLEYSEDKAQALRREGRLEDAAAVHEALLRVMGGHALSHLALGDLYEEMKQAERAAAEFRIFLDIWSEADAGLPQFEHARQRLSTLNAHR